MGSWRKFGLTAGFMTALAGGALGALPPAHTTRRSPRAASLPNVTAWTIDHGTKMTAQAWKHALHFSLPYEVSPQPDQLAPVKTRVFAAYTNRYFWMQFRAYDPDPQHIRFTYRRRDSLSSSSDDYVGMVLSPFNDTQWAYEFFCTPGGSETDLFRQQGTEYASFNAIWSCWSQRTAYGYVVTFRVPFRSLDLPSSKRPQTWRLLAARNWPRKFGYQLTGVKLDPNDSCIVCQARVLKTEGPISHTGTNVQIIPAATIVRKDERRSGSSGALVDGTPKLSGGLDVRWQIRPDLDWSMTLNPDFSQVAPDVLQFTVNRRFAINYPENRPFFNNGIWAFDTPLTLVDTRQIADPHWATKLVGQVGSNVIGAMVANDSLTNVLLPGPQGSTIDSFSFTTRDALLRYRRDLPGNSSIGALVTSRQGGGYRNDLVAADGLWQIDPSDSVSFQLAASQTRYPNQVADEFGVAPGTLAGSALQVTYNRLRKNYQTSLTVTDISQGFRADLGFIPQVDYLEAKPSFTYVWYGPQKGWYQQWGVGGFWDWVGQNSSGPILSRTYQAFAYLNLLDETDLQVGLQHQAVFVNNRVFPLNQAVLTATSQPASWLNLQLTGTLGDGVDYTIARAGKLISLSPSLTAAIGSHLKLALTLGFERLRSAGQRLYSAQLYDARASWYFNSTTFIRLIVQEQRVTRDLALYPSGTNGESNTLAMQWLIGYEVNPWTSVYAGVADGYLGINQEPLAVQQRTFFIKGSYDFRP